jgi:hypothetical protein
MSWAPPDDDGGAPILHYVVREERKGATQQCDTNECVFRKLESAGHYSFRVKAVNRVGDSAWSDLSRTAQADTAPGRVQNIRMHDRGDGFITVAWDKPSTQTSRIIDYTITWVGGQAVVPGETTRFTAQGLDNNQKYVFTIKAQNRVDYSLPRSSPEMQSLGTPSPPPAPAVTDLESGANQTSLRVSWQAVLPEGPGPTAYTVTYTNGSASGAVPGCQKLVALTCTHTGVPYDGLVYTYRVVASNQPTNEPGNRSQPSEATSIEAVGRPAAWGAFQVYPTGNSQEAEVQYTVPDSRGTTSRVEVLVGGQVVKAFAQQTGTNTTRIPTPGNEQPYPVQLRVCNENAPAGCTLSGTQNVQTFGRLEGMLNGIGAASVNGKNLTWTITGTSNGDPGELAISVNNGPETVVPLGPVGAFSVPFSYTAADYEQNVDLRVTLRDPAPANRGSDVQTRSDTSGPPPPPQITLSRSPCNDTAGSAGDACTFKGNLEATGGCLEATCGFLVITTTDMTRSFGCDISNSRPPTQTYNRQFSGNQAHRTDIVYREGFVTVTCDENGGNREAGTTTWEWR